jgi:hypothetical protein
MPLTASGNAITGRPQAIASRTFVLTPEPETIGAKNT